MHVGSYLNQWHKLAVCCSRRVQDLISVCKPMEVGASKADCQF